MLKFKSCGSVNDINSLVLEITLQVRFKLDKEWERDQVFKQMGGLWRASKSRLVSDVKNATNEEERLQLQPDNIKLVHDWKDFVKEKTSQEFKKEKSVNPSSITRFEVWTRGHTKRHGTPINSKVAETIVCVRRWEQKGINLAKK
ncbi:uncharacterized protein LOC131308221 isoform X2 [Rhododendron vialii]|uniref:uncharacterized protein LOC131308221 isoform X2 n=1 Tax=Rhododendron vialii TaxID=182163 RepID=UPI00265DCE81|nr:uncharacterized protein LOC131308221 isoform X2 [Rhododendron vialii]